MRRRSATGHSFSPLSNSDSFKEEQDINVVCVRAQEAAPRLIELVSTIERSRLWADDGIKELCRQCRTYERELKAALGKCRDRHQTRGASVTRIFGQRSDYVVDDTQLRVALGCVQGAFQTCAERAERLFTSFSDPEFQGALNDCREAYSQAGQLRQLVHGAHVHPDEDDSNAKAAWSSCIRIKSSLQSRAVTLENVITLQWHFKVAIMPETLGAQLDPPPSAEETVFRKLQDALQDIDDALSHCERLGRWSTDDIGHSIVLRSLDDELSDDSLPSTPAASTSTFLRLNTPLPEHPMASSTFDNTATQHSFLELPSSTQSKQHHFCLRSFLRAVMPCSGHWGTDTDLPHLAAVDPIQPFDRAEIIQEPQVSSRHVCRIFISGERSPAGVNVKGCIESDASVQELLRRPILRRRRHRRSGVSFASASTTSLDIEYFLHELAHQDLESILLHSTEAWVPSLVLSGPTGMPNYSQRELYDTQRLSPTVEIRTIQPRLSFEFLDLLLPGPSLDGIDAFTVDPRDSGEYTANALPELCLDGFDVSSIEKQLLAALHDLSTGSPSSNLLSPPAVAVDVTVTAPPEAGRSVQYTSDPSPSLSRSSSYARGHPKSLLRYKSSRSNLQSDFPPGILLWGDGSHSALGLRKAISMWGFCQNLTGDIYNLTPRPYTYGGLGDVYRAFCQLDNKPATEVAIKVLRLRSQDPGKSLRRLQREFRVWLQLEHPNILPLYGVYFGAGFGELPALVSPWCMKGDICTYLRHREGEGGLLSLKIKLLMQIMEGLAYLHSRRPAVIHGDLKGANILLSDDDEVQLCDFGFASMRAEEGGPLHAQSSSAKGTLRWMSPELFTHDDARLTQESDIWAFGCVVGEVLCGKVPYHEKRADQKVILAIVGGEFPSHPEKVSGNLSEVNLHEKLWRLTRECWAADPKDRPSVHSILWHLKDCM